jgi:hypothetical protein
MAVSALAVAIALHVAAGLLRSTEPELIGCGIAVLVGYALYFINRFQRSRW